MNIWLTSKGVTLLQYQYEQTDGKFSSFKILQSFETNCQETYLSQKIDIALFYSMENVVFSEVLVKADAVTDVTELFVG